MALTGSTQSLPLFDALGLLGRDVCRERLRQAIRTLDAVSIPENHGQGVTPIVKNQAVLDPEKTV
ncbi:MAG: hypothetical protein ACYDBH_01885 [Acidobacteriaceae bacterium]